MQQISFKTPRGADVSIQIVTEREWDIDHTVKVPCYEMRTVVNGNWYGCGFDFVDHPEHGAVLIIGGIPLIQVPAAQAEEVRGFLAAYKAEVSRRVKADLAKAGACDKPVSLGSFEQEEADEIAIHGRRGRRS